MDQKSQSINRLKNRKDTINSDVNLGEIYELIEQNLIKINENIINKNDIHAVEFFNNFKKNKNFNFPINKHIEIYIKNNFRNIDKIFDYLVFRYKFYLSGKNKINLGYPPYLLIEPVSSCNLQCPFCFQSDQTFRRKPFMGVMKYDLYKKILDEANDIGVGAITLASRGEPTLHKNYVDMIEYTASKKNIFELKTNTNASFLTEEICHALLGNNVNQIVISADHYIKDEYEKRRLGSNFEKILKNVDMLFNIREKNYKNSITEIRISGIDNDRNLDRKKFHEFWIKRCDHVVAGFPTEKWDTYNNDIDEKIVDPCENLWDRMYIWFDGKVNPCDADYKSLLSFGNVNQNSIKEIWSNNSIAKLRQDHLKNNRRDHNPCNKCGVTFC